MPPANSPTAALVDTWGRKNRKLYDRSCAQCGSMFRPTRASASYCSTGCARKKNGGQNKRPESWWVGSKGYIEGRVWIDGEAVRVKKHRHVMEEKLGRSLRADEDVHHEDKNKANNDPGNLVLLTHAEHSALHAAQTRANEKLSRADLKEILLSKQSERSLARKFGVHRSRIGQIRRGQHRPIKGENK